MNAGQYFFRFIIGTKHRADIRQGGTLIGCILFIAGQMDAGKFYRHIVFSNNRRGEIIFFYLVNDPRYGTDAAVPFRRENLCLCGLTGWHDITFPRQRPG